jgi:hypothetical protein
MAVLPIFLALAGAPLTAVLTEAREVVIAQADLRVSDVAQLSGGAAAERARLGAVTVARLPAGRRIVALSRAGLADLVRRSTGLLVNAGAEGSLTIRLENTGTTLGASGCWAAAVDIAVGTAMTSEKLTEIPCAVHAPVGLVRLDRGSGLLRAEAPVAAGTALGRMAASSGGIQSGTSMTLTSRSGPVAVSRPVTTLQRGREGRRIFVRDQDGSVMTVRVQPSERSRP